MANLNKRANPNNALKIDETAGCCESNPCKDLNPKFTYLVEKDEDEHNITLTDASVYPDGDGADKVYWYLSQDNESVIGDQPLSGTPQEVDLIDDEDVTVDLNKPLHIKMKVVSDNGCINWIDIELSSATLQIAGEEATTVELG